MEQANEQLRSGISHWDAVDAWFDCVMRCPVDGSENCVTTCMRKHLGEEQELWLSSLCP